MAASATPQPRRPRPRTDRRDRPPRPPHGAIRGSSRISGARCAGCAAAHPTATARQATSRVGASACCRICHAAAEAPDAARGSTPPTTTAASEGDPGGYRHLRRALRPTRRSTPRCDRTASQQPRRRIGRCSSCHAAAEAPEAARGSPRPTTTAASWGDPRLWPHLRRALRRMRCGRPHCDRTASHHARPSVGPLQLLPRRSRGHARIDAAAHHGRLMGRSAGPTASPARDASNAPRHTLLRPHGEPPAAAARRPAQLLPRRSRAARRSPPPLTTAASCSIASATPQREGEREKERPNERECEVRGRERERESARLANHHGSLATSCSQRGLF